MNTDSSPSRSAIGHKWTFFSAGGLDQALIETADDYRNIAKLDQKLWVALSCPVKGLEFDPRTLEIIDSDKDGRVRAPEMIKAVEWACAMLKNPGDLSKGRDGLPLEAIDDSSSAGKALLASAKQVLINLGKPEATTLSVADTADTVRLFADTLFNGDGVIIPEATDDPALKQVVKDIMLLEGAISDRSGKLGIDKAKADAFFAECKAYAAWWEGGGSAKPLRDDTPTAYAAFSAVKAKISDYFARCRLAAYDHRAAAALNRAEQDFLAFAAKDLSIDTDEVVGLPLQRVEPRKPLNLLDEVNPAWSGKLAAFVQAVVHPLIGADKESLTDAEWTDLCFRFVSYETWLVAKKGEKVEKLGIDRVRALLASGAQAAVDDLILKDLAVAPHVSGFEFVDRLTHYYRDLGLLVRNFVNFADFYDPKMPSIFQIGTLYLDQRSCTLCIRVDDPSAHLTLGSLGKIFIAYCACTRPSGEKMFIAACFTQGDGDYLMAGRNGLFYDRRGRDWDATIVKIIDNPISIRQAFWSPYKKVIRFVEEQVAKRAAAADEAANAKLQGAATTAVDVAQKGRLTPDKPRFEVGTIAALGVGLGAIGTLLGGAIGGFLGLGWWMPLGILGIVILISGPSMLIAWLKLRQRTLGPILEGTGWAINGRVKINIPLGTSLTGAKKLPPGATRLFNDPFVDKDALRQRRITILSIVLIIVAVIWWQWPWLVAKWKEHFAEAPAATAPAAPPATPPAPAAK